MMTCLSFRSVRLGACLFLLVLGLGGAAPPAGPDTPAKPAAATTDELKKLVGTLQDDQQRAQLVKQLQALIAVQQQTAAVAEPVDADDLIGAATARLQQFGDDLASTAAVVVDVPV